MRHDPRAHLLDMKDAAVRALKYVEGTTRESFLLDEIKLWAVYSQIIVIGEAANRLNREWQANHPAISWNEIIGMRNRMVHGYDIINWELVWDSVITDLPELISNIDTIFEAESGD